MKWWQYFFIIAAIYVAPRMSESVAMWIAAAMTLCGLIALFRSE
jgi:hypothetical protein